MFGTRVYIAPGESPDLGDIVPEELEMVEIASLSHVEDGDFPAVLYLTRALTEGEGVGRELRDIPDHVVVVAGDTGGRILANSVSRLFLSTEDFGPDGRTLLRVLTAASQHSEALLECYVSAELADSATGKVAELNRIGMALMSERDPEALLTMILTQARRLTLSDAGSLYLVEEDDDGKPRLHFLRAQNDSLPEMPNPDFTLPIDRSSVSGCVASDGEPIVLEDVYHLPGNAPYTFNRGFDEEHGYRAKSMLVVPMKDHRDQVVGVLQLINRKHDPNASIRSDEDADAHVLGYSMEDVEMVCSLAGQAAVSIENGQLYQDIENLFEGFITAAVTAIDQRDPTTSGHSVRVTHLTCDTAELINQQTDGPFADAHFSVEEMKQLRYAGLLHDFGKVGVPEEVLVKVRKLPPVLGAKVEARFQLIRKTIEADAATTSLDVVRDGDDPQAVLERLAKIDAQRATELELLDRYWTAITEADIPRVLEEDAAGVLKDIALKTFIDPAGAEHAWLTADELHFLSIRRGNLDEHERKLIESHVVHSYEFLLNIPWTQDLARIAEIVRGHHEKLNGKGYPDGVTGESLSLETRIMTVCDIFDALTASDRPYKKAMPVEKALQILRWEAEEGALDSDIVELFATSGVYERVLKADWRELLGGVNAQMGA